MAAGERVYPVTLKALVSGFTAVGVLISFLTFNIGRASVVSDLRKEIQEKYVERIQYRTDQDQLAASMSEIKAQNKSLDDKVTSLLLLLTRNRKMVADSLIAEPD